MKFIKTCNTGLYHVERTVAVVSFIAMIGIMFIQVFCRYMIHSSLAWSEESMRFLFILTSFFGAGCCSYEHKHVVIDFLGTIVRHFVKEESTQDAIFSAVDVLVSVVCTAFFIYMGNVMLNYAFTLKEQNSLSSAMMMPQWWLGYAIVAALFGCAIHFFLEIFIASGNLIDDIKGGKK